MRALPSKSEIKIVSKDMCDHNGHMNFNYYYQLFDSVYTAMYYKDLGFDDPDNVTPAEVKAALLSKSSENVSKPPATDGESGGGSDRGTSPRPVLRPSSNDDDAGPPITPPSGPSTTVNTTPPAASGPTASTGGGMTGSDTRPDDPRGEGQYGGQSTSSSGSSSSSGGMSAADVASAQEAGKGYSGGYGFNKGGLMKKPKKKK